MDGLRQPVRADFKRPVAARFAERDLKVRGMQRLFTAEREMERVGDDMSCRNVAKPGDRYIMGRRAETIGIGRIEKGAEQICCGNRLALPRQKRERSFGVNDRLHTFAQAGQFQHGFKAAAGLVDEMDIQPVRALI
ncbi:hypothetical protein D3C78_1236540 [compost metagenome]